MIFNLQSILCFEDCKYSPSALFMKISIGKEFTKPKSTWRKIPRVATGSWRLGAAERHFPVWVKRKPRGTFTSIPDF